MECTKIIMHKKSDFITFFQTLAQWVAIVALGVPPSGANPASMLELVEPLGTARTMSGTTKNKSFFEEEEEHNNPLSSIFHKNWIITKVKKFSAALSE